ncbi:glycosyltransferase [Pelosinus sp. UFO1]|uniref:MGDG synthase family glycosyltransferase n=1 Tax=Pelosinus sp. UFO1 TaxID=484770 RepID=UPI0004D0DDFC|nr:glycosyltransferase [Pelosinus sp. UFO1]AIF53247.1 Monogalactosyldiacylglycerol synthase [Pelosinus sp. UFO1]
MKSKRILIVSASIGNGHMQAASAICEELKESTSCNVEIVDFLQVGQFRYPKLNRLQIEFMKLMKSSYYGMLKVAPYVYKEIYKITEKQHTRKVIDFINAANQKTMANLIASYRPHLVICTHPFPLGAASQLRCKKKRDFTLVGVITDFAVHSWWLGDRVDHYFVANEVMARELQEHAISASQITCAGIPVGKSFTPVGEKVRKQVPHVLVMGGGLGFGRMETTLQELEKLPSPIAVTVVAGKNQEFEERARILARTLHNKVTVLPFSPHIATMMKQADLLITKPGGITCSEALAVNLPMILLNPLPGQEEENAYYLNEQGSAIWIQDDREIVGKTAALLFGNQKWLQEMQAKCAEISPEFATSHIVEKISSLADVDRKEAFFASGYWQGVGGQSC